MIAIFKKELKSYLTSMIGYVFIAFILAVVGIYFGIYNLSSGYPELGLTLNSVTFVFLIVTPILTMRILAEEKKQKTDQMLLTAPVSVSGIVLGKFLALVCIFLIPVAVVCLYPLILGTLGTINYATSYVAILGYFFLGCATLAVGLFVSSLTESQVIAAVISFGLLFLTYIMSGLEDYLPTEAIQTVIIYAVLVILVAALIYNMTKSIIAAVVVGVIGEAALAAVYFIKSDLLAGSIQKIMGAFELTTHFENFINGMIDIKGIVYYISVVLIFIFLTMQSIQKRRWS
jgi:ABC-2 type transport system permease protein